MLSEEDSEGPGGGRPLLDVSGDEGGRLKSDGSGDEGSGSATIAHNHHPPGGDKVPKPSGGAVTMNNSQILRAIKKTAQSEGVENAGNAAGGNTSQNGDQVNLPADSEMDAAVSEQLDHADHPRHPSLSDLILGPKARRFRPNDNPKQYRNATITVSADNSHSDGSDLRLPASTNAEQSENSSNSDRLKVDAAESVVNIPSQPVLKETEHVYLNSTSPASSSPPNFRQSTVSPSLRPAASGSSDAAPPIAPAVYAAAALGSQSTDDDLPINSKARLSSSRSLESSRDNDNEAASPLTAKATTGEESAREFEVYDYADLVDYGDDEEDEVGREGASLLQQADSLSDEEYYDYYYEEGRIRIPFNYSGLQFTGLKEIPRPWNAKTAFIEQVGYRLYMFVPAIVGGVLLGVLLWAFTILIMRSYGSVRQRLFGPKKKKDKANSRGSGCGGGPHHNALPLTAIKDLDVHRLQVPGETPKSSQQPPKRQTTFCPASAGTTPYARNQLATTASLQHANATTAAVASHINEGYEDTENLSADCSAVSPRLADTTNSSQYMTMGPVTGHVTAAAAVTSEDNPVMTEVDIHEAAADQASLASEESKSSGIGASEKGSLNSSQSKSDENIRVTATRLSDNCAREEMAQSPVIVTTHSQTRLMTKSPNSYKDIIVRAETIGLEKRRNSD